MNLISVVLLLITLFAPHKEASHLVILEKSITVNGNTSLGGFNCSYKLSGQSDTLFIDKRGYNPYCFSIPVKEFACGNFLLNKDFQYTLKAAEYPEIAVKVLSLQPDDKPGVFMGNVELALVGKTKILKEVVFIKETSGQQASIVANFVFLASEFELTPPKRFGGLIKADDLMNVTVALSIQ